VTTAVRSSPWREETIDDIIHIVCVRVCVCFMSVRLICAAVFIDVDLLG
jgi:hypothetical protein